MNGAMMAALFASIVAAVIGGLHADVREADAQRARETSVHPETSSPQRSWR